MSDFTRPKVSVFLAKCFSWAFGQKILVKNVSAFLVRVFPVVFGENISNAILPLIPRGHVGWMASAGFVTTVLRTYFRDYLRLPTSTITIRRYDRLFGIAVEALADLRQPTSMLVKAASQGMSDLDSDEDVEEEGESVVESHIWRSEPDFGMNLYWYNWRPIWVERAYINGSGTSQPLEVLRLSVWSWSPQTMMKIFDSWVRKLQDTEGSYTMVQEYDSQYGDDWSVITSKPSRSLDSVILPRNMKMAVVNDLANFLQPKTRRWYNEHYYPYRRGYLYHGDPGTGKSTFAFALAGHFHLDLYVVPVNDSSIGQQGLSRLFRGLGEPCIVLLEDIDALDTTTLERGSSQASRSGTQNLSTLLNLLDGVTAKENIILMMTTNHLEALDKALVRPGRIDMEMLFTKIERSELYELFVFNYSTNQEISQLAQQWSETVPASQFSVAEVQNYLFRYRNKPHSAVNDVGSWVEQKLKERSSGSITPVEEDGQST